MARTWTVREFGFGDIDLIKELYRAVRGQIRPMAYDQWRYLNSPMGLAPGAIAMEGGRAVGFYVLWPTPLCLDGTSIHGAQSMDTMTHPDFRGQGIFVALAQACYDITAARGIRLLYGFPNMESYPGFVRRLGWTHTDDIRHWIRPLRLSRKPGMPAWMGKLADAAEMFWPTGRAKECAVESSAVASDSCAALMANKAMDGQYRIERTPAWLSWRYGLLAGQDYEWITASTGERAAAVAVWGMRNESWGAAMDGRAHLVELTGEKPAARAAVLATVIARARAHGAWVLETVTNDPGSVTSLRRAGFISHRAAPLIVRVLGAETFSPNPLVRNAWRIMGGDLDTF